MPTRECDDLTPVGQTGADGGRLVFYEYCVSLVLLTLRRPSRLYRLGPDEWGLRRGLPYTILSFLLGWWGIPWGLIYTPLVLWTNLNGGRVVTAQEGARWAGPAETPGKEGDRHA